MAILLFCLLQIRCVFCDAICARWLQENYDKQFFLPALHKKREKTHNSLPKQIYSGCVMAMCFRRKDKFGTILPLSR